LSRRFLFPISIAVAAAFFAAVAASPRRASAATAPRCEISGVSRVVAIGDVHGAIDRFTEILKAVNLVDAGGHWAGGTAHLVQLGDVVDRGPDSRAALDLLRRLEGEAERAGGGVHALLGNHEVARMLGDLRFATPGEYAAFTDSDSESVRLQFVRSSKPELRDQLIKETPRGMVEMRAAFGRRGPYGEWLRKKDAVVKINGVLFVHGGISPAVAAMPCDRINATVRTELTDDLDKTRAAPLESLAARPDGPFWYRGLAQMADTDAATVETVLSKQNVRAIVIAHSVTSDGRISVRFGGKLFQIDTGMQPAYVQGGRPSALEFADGKVSAVYLDRRDQLLDSF
jgi:hypothetical protein